MHEFPPFYIIKLYVYLTCKSRRAARSARNWGAQPLLKSDVSPRGRNFSARVQGWQFMALLPSPEPGFYYDGLFYIGHGPMAFIRFRCKKATQKGRRRKRTFCIIYDTISGKKVATAIWEKKGSARFLRPSQIS